MAYLIDLGYRRRKLVFPTLNEANEFANEVMRKTKEVLAITETSKEPTHNYRTTDKGKFLCPIEFLVTGWTNKTKNADVHYSYHNRKRAINKANELKDICEMIVVRMEDVLIDKEDFVCSVSSPIYSYSI